MAMTPKLIPADLDGATVLIGHAVAFCANGSAIIRHNLSAVRRTNVSSFGAWH
jgi:hypothetical protein